MHARVTLLEIDTVRVSLDDALELYKSEVVPRLRDEPGYCGTFVMSTPEGKGAVMTMWDTEEQAAVEVDHRFYGEILESYATFFRSPPGRERYEILYVDEPTRTR